MDAKTITLAAFASAGLCLFLQGCGGMSMGPSPAASALPSGLVLQAGSTVAADSNQVQLAVAARGTLVLAGIDAKGIGAVWYGSMKVGLPEDVDDASVAALNRNYAVAVSGHESVVWPYRSNGTPVTLRGWRIAAAAKNSDVFLAVSASRRHSGSTAAMLTVRGRSAVRSEFIAPDLNGGVIRGVAINASGAAIVAVTPREAAWDPIVGSATERQAALRARMPKAGDATGYYLLAPGQAPIPFEMPLGAFGATLLAINNRGVSIGAAGTGSAENPHVVPCYWDRLGHAHLMHLAADLDFGYAADIDDQGAAVGSVGNEITSYGALWNTLDDSPINVNALVPRSFPLNIQFLDSVGNDFTLAASGNPKADPRRLYYFGLQPR